MAAAVSKAGGEGEGRREAVGEVKAASPFERLPDELLLAVLEQVHLDTPLLKVDRLAALAADKRLYRLARVVAFRAVGPSSQENQVVILPRLFARIYLHPLVKSLEYIYSHTFVTYDTALLPLLRNLTSLTLKDLDPPGNAQQPLLVATSLTAMLKQLRNLERLVLKRASWFAFEDPSFRLCRDLPSLRSLKLEDCAAEDAGCSQLLEDLSNIVHLELDCFRLEAAYSRIPWSSVRSLSLTVTDGSDILLPEADALLNSLERAIYPEASAKPQLIPLRTLSLGGWALDMEDRHDPDMYRHGLGSQSLTKLFRLLAGTQLKRLRLWCPEELRNSQRDVTLPSVKVLIFDGVSMGDIRVQDLPAFPNLLDVFPNLEHLVLDNISIQDRETGILKPPPHELTPSILALQYPTVSSLVQYLTASRVLSITWRRPCEAAWLRWERNSPTQEFKLERYRR
ncbi:hypothetical protein JCM10213_007758 [Rhodosporidiobolus nylandii]